MKMFGNKLFLEIFKLNVIHKLCQQSLKEVKTDLCKRFNIHLLENYSKLIISEDITLSNLYWNMPYELYRFREGLQ